METRKKTVGQSVRELAVSITLLVAVVVGAAQGQEKVTYGQNMYLMKSLLPSLQNVGVIASTLTQADIQSLGRAAAALGLKVSVAQVTELRDVAAMYKRLVNDYRVDMIWIPDKNDALLLGIGFEYLRENSIVDRIGLLVPARQFVSKGALCSLERDNGILTVYFNKRVASVDGIKTPAQQGDGITYVLQ